LIFQYPIVGFCLEEATLYHSHSRYVQISAPVQPGNSGGPLLDQNGNLVGMVTAKLQLARSGDLPQSVNFALNASIIAFFLYINGIKYTLGFATSALKPTRRSGKGHELVHIVQMKPLPRVRTLYPKLHVARTGMVVSLIEI
jgi:S1-C subfamily serine protease